MKKATKLLLLPAFAAAFAWAFSPTSLAVDRSVISTPKRINGLSLLQQTGGRAEVPVLVLARKGEAGAVARQVASMGGTVTTVIAGADFVAARLPAANLPELERSKAVRALGLDREVKLDPMAMRPLDDRSVTPASAADPALSLRVTRGEIRAPQLIEATGNDGSGAVIAILDTGVDPGHPALQRTPAGEPKLIDWQDFTGEGDVAVKETSTTPVPGVVSQSGVYRFGTFQESQIPPGEMASDINRNGSSTDSFRVLVTDSATADVYDTVYVDTNMDGRFTDEQPLRAFNKSGDRGIFSSGDGGAEAGVNFVVTRISPDGSLINLGYDGGQHGTHVAGIAAGSGPVTGVAPGAKVMAIKVLTSGGSGNWQGIIQGMQYAAEHGAHVINMSLGGMAELNDGNDPQSLLIQDLTAKHGSLFSIAAGNSGPGLNTMGLPGVAGDAITSGAYISKTTWKVDYGLDVPKDGLWYFSSAGPRDDGGLKPNIVAPGTANSAIPTWAGDYAVFQGTSMATPQTSGAAALLIGAAKAKGMEARPEHVRMALETGARRLDGYGWYEQGHGLIQVDAAWQKLQSLVTETNPSLVSFGKAKPGTTASGLYAREVAVPRQDQKWVLGNREFQSSTVDLTYLPGNGLTISGPARATLPGLQRREIPLRFQYDATAPGIYDALIQARVGAQTGYAKEYLATVVVPHEFDPARGNRITDIRGTIGTAAYARHFVRVPAGTAELSVTLNVPDKQGRVRLMAYTPDGMPAGDGTAWAGAPDSPDSQTLTIPNPQPGVWELDAYASHGAMTYGLASHKYTIDVAARGIYASPGKVALTPHFGATQRRNITLTNFYGDMKVKMGGAGFVQPESQRLEVAHGDVNDQFFTVSEGTAMVQVATSQVMDPAADLDLALYYNHPARGWMPVGTVTGHRLGRQVVLLAPEPGQYAAEVVGKDVPSGRTSFVLSTAIVAEGDGVQVSDAASERSLGSVWTEPVSFRLPGARGQYLGAVTVRDAESGKLLTVVPVSH